jgi:PAS domain S-box-containing protein
MLQHAHVRMLNAMFALSPEKNCSAKGSGYEPGSQRSQDIGQSTEIRAQEDDRECRPSMPRNEFQENLVRSFDIAQIVEACRHAIITINSLGRITIWNQAAENMFGYSAIDVIGAPLAQLFPEYTNVLHVFETSGAPSSGQIYETKHRRKSGQLIDVSSRISPIKDCTGKTIGLSAILSDITP